MSKMTKFMLTLMFINIIGTVLLFSGILDDTRFPIFDVTFPLAAIFYGLFLIWHMLDIEVARYDAEHSEAHSDTPASKHSESDEFNHDHVHHTPMRA